jgi:hypothetical protein
VITQKDLQDAFLEGFEYAEDIGHTTTKKLVAEAERRYPASEPSAAQAEPGLHWYPWVCVNGHKNDHAKLAPDGTHQCATPDCHAEAEAVEPSTKQGG